MWLWPTMNEMASNHRTTRTDPRISARVAGAAGGDEVLLTEATHDAVGEVDGVELESLGKCAFETSPNLSMYTEPTYRVPVWAVYRSIRYAG